MSRIRITQFGGLSPSTDPRNLPEDGAQIARNLDMRFGDFRPAKGLGPSVATVPAGTVSIFRTPSGQWLSSTTDTDYVNAPVAEAERVYLTGRSEYPEAWQGGTYRRLGVPAPTVKPEVTLIENDEFDQTDADNAQAAALTAVTTALLAADSQVWLGNAVPTAGAPPAVDPIYPKVQLHLQFNTLSGGHFVDSSPQKRLLTNVGAVALTTDALGPLGASGGAGYATFTGGSITVPFIDRKSWDADPTWTVDASIVPTDDLEWVVIFARNGGIRELTMQVAGAPDAVGNYRTIFSSDFGGAFSSIIRCKRLGGGNAAPAGVKTHISVQNIGSAIQVYIDGVLCGSYPAGQHLEIHNIGRSSFTGTQAFIGKMDELRVTFAARNTANFTPPVGEYGVLVAAPGIFVAHGDPLGVNLPTTDAGDAAYVVPMTLVGGSYQITNAGDAYLAAPSLGGVQVTYNGSVQWAVPLNNWRASGLATSLATTDSTLANVEDPADPPNKLLTAGEATALAAPVFALYDPVGSPVLGLVSAINSAQADLRAQLGAGGDAALLATRITLLQSASAALEAHFAAIEASIRRVLNENASTIFGSIAARVVARSIETRSYVVTYVTDWGEESAPSPASDLLTLDQNDSVQLTCPSPPPGRFIVGWRLYRSSTTERGAAFQLVDGTGEANAVIQDGGFAYFDASNLSHLDDAKQEELQESLQTLTWIEPPTNLKGLVALPNGILAGFFDRTLCFSVPYAGYAWPLEYQQTVKYRIVGLAVYGQTVTVMTEGHPYFFSGADSASMSGQEVESPQACISKRTIAAVEGGVVYASPDGLCLAGPGGVEVLTTSAFSKTDWQALVNSGAFGAYSDGSYYLFTAGS